MGLDFSHCDAHWAYSGFMRFRKRVAARIGIGLMKMDGFQGMLPSKEYECFGAMAWEFAPYPEIHSFLYHSDCDGYLTPEECEQIEPLLRRIVETFPDTEEYRWDTDKKMGLELCDGMRRAIELNENFVFC
jgi:hypothetical protein